MARAVLAGAAPAGAVLAGAVMAGAALAGSVIAGAVLAGAVLVGSVLVGTVLEVVRGWCLWPDECRIVCIIEFCLCRASCPQIGGPSLLGKGARKAPLCETVNNANAEPNAKSNAYSNRLHHRMQIHVHNRILLMQSKLSTNRRALPFGKVAPESQTLRNIKQCEGRTECNI